MLAARYRNPRLNYRPTLGSVSSQQGSIDLSATGSINGTSSTLVSTLDLGGRISLHAGKNIGTVSNPLRTQTSKLDILSGGGMIQIANNNNGNLRIEMADAGSSLSIRHGSAGITTVSVGSLTAGADLLLQNSHQNGKIDLTSSLIVADGRVTIFTGAAPLSSESHTIDAPASITQGGTVTIQGTGSLVLPQGQLLQIEGSSEIITNNRVILTPATQNSIKLNSTFIRSALRTDENARDSEEFESTHWIPVGFKQHTTDLKASTNSTGEVRTLEYAIVKEHLNGSIRVVEGEILFSARKASQILVGDETLTIRAGTVLLIRNSDNRTIIRNVFDRGSDSVKIHTHHQRGSCPLDVGQELSIFTHATRAHDDVGRRKGRSWVVGGRTYRHSEISLPSLLHNNRLARVLRQSSYNEDQVLSRKLVKMAACLSVVNSGHGAFDER